MPDLSTEVCGLRLKNPVISGAGPNTRNFDTVAAGVDAGCGAIVVRSLHLQYVGQKRPSSRGFWRIVGGRGGFLSGHYGFHSTGARAVRVHDRVSPGFGGAAPFPTLKEYQAEVGKMVDYASRRGCRIIASIGWCGSCVSSDDLWREEALAMAEAGVDAIQLHTAPSPATDPGRYIQFDPEKYLANPIRVVKRTVPHLPVIAKLSSDCCDAITAARIAEEAGADAVVPTGRWMSLVVDDQGEGFTSWKFPGYGGSWSHPILMAQIVRMRHPEKVGSYHDETGGAQEALGRRVTVPIIPSGGVRSGKDVVNYVAAGAHAAEVCAHILIEGYSCIGRILQEMRVELSRRGIGSINDIRDTLRLIESPPQWLAHVDPALCTGCGTCEGPCMNRAIQVRDGVAGVDPDLCEGCRSCHYVCPQQAISITTVE